MDDFILQIRGKAIAWIALPYRYKFKICILFFLDKIATCDRSVRRSQSDPRQKLSSHDPYNLIGDRIELQIYVNFVEIK